MRTPQSATKKGEMRENKQHMSRLIHIESCASTRTQKIIFSSKNDY